MRTSSQSTGLFASLFHALKVDSFLQKFHGNSALVVTVFLYGLIGVFVGFCARHYMRSIVLGILFCAVSIKLGEFAGVSAMTLKWARIYQMTGVSPHDTLSMTLHVYVSWVRGHIIQVMSMVVGFFIGIKFV